MSTTANSPASSAANAPDAAQRLPRNYTETVQAALKALGKDDLTVIIHGSSFPAEPAFDTGFGSPYSAGAKRLVSFMEALGFNSIQLGPGGKLKPADGSPYTSTSFSANPLFIDLAVLAKEGLLPEADLKQAVSENSEAMPQRSRLREACDAVQKALEKAYDTFMAQLAQGQGQAKQLDTEFQAYIKTNAEWLEKDALYEALAVHHDNDYWPHWPEELDRDLFHQGDNANGQKQVEARVAQLKSNPDTARTMAVYQFSQFLVARQKDDFKHLAEKHRLRMFADLQVGLSDRDTWANQALFMQGYSLGVPPDMFSDTGQAWGFPVLHPEALFLPDGKRGPAGDLMFRLFSKIFRENPGGVRIDHIVGLIDPWVYPSDADARVESGAGRLYSSPDHDVFRHFTNIPHESINWDETSDSEERVISLDDEQVKRYARVLQIALDAAAAEGLGNDAIICEDLGTLTTPVKAVMAHYGLSGIRLTQFSDPFDLRQSYRARNAGARHWIMTGSHDNPPVLVWAKDLKKTDLLDAHAAALAVDLGMQEQSDEANLKLWAAKPEAFTAAKLGELFASPARHVQIFFTDIFGIAETYNRPGTSGDKNWTLRLPNRFEDLYFTQIGKGLALNLPDALLIGMRARGEAFLSANAELVSRLEVCKKALAG